MDPKLLLLIKNRYNIQHDVQHYRSHSALTIHVKEQLQESRSSVCLLQQIFLTWPSTAITNTENLSFSLFHHITLYTELNDICFFFFFFYSIIHNSSSTWIWFHTCKAYKWNTKAFDGFLQLLLNALIRTHTFLTLTWSIKARKEFRNDTAEDRLRLESGNKSCTEEDYDYTQVFIFKSFHTRKTHNKTL